MTIKDVAEHLQVSWDTIKDIQARSLQRRFGKPKLHKLKEIAIDEIAVGKGHHYVTVVLNLRSGAVVFVGDGKGVEALEPFLEAPAPIAGSNPGSGRRGECRARASGIRMLAQFADTLERHQEGVLNCYDYRISTGPLEGTNTKIQLMKRQVYGFHDRAFFKLTILGLHETKHALVG